MSKQPSDDIYLGCRQCQDTGFIQCAINGLIPCPVCGVEDINEKESQSSKHCDSGYMNDVRFGE